MADDGKKRGLIAATMAVAAMVLPVATASVATLAAPAARAAPTDPAAIQVDGLDNALLDAMKNAKALGVSGRFHKLEPVVARVFDTPTMVRIAVGADWPSIPPAKQQALIASFARLTAASYAKNFSSFSGQHFEINPTVITRGPDKLVQTQLFSPGDAPVAISYRMRQSGGVWKVIDVLYGSISQLNTRHSDFAASLSQGGADALATHLNALVDKQLK